jgi:hypothetical protein
MLRASPGGRDRPNAPPLPLAALATEPSLAPGNGRIGDPAMATATPAFDAADWSDDDPEGTEELAFLVSLRRDRLADGRATEWRGIVEERRSGARSRVRGWQGVMEAMWTAEALQQAERRGPGYRLETAMAPASVSS